MPNLLCRNKMIQTDRRNFRAQLLSDSTNKFSGLSGVKKLPFVSLWSNLCFAAWCSEVMDTSQHTHTHTPVAAVCSSGSPGSLQQPQWLCLSSLGREGGWPSPPCGRHRSGQCLKEEGERCWSAVPSSAVAPWGRGAPQRPFVPVPAGSRCCLWKTRVGRALETEKELSK